MTRICKDELLNIKDLKALINKKDSGILFCFGNSFISKIIEAKTRTDIAEVIPSHVALICNGTFLYESTSLPDKLGCKTIPAGVRRYLLKDFYRLEKDKGTLYYFTPYELNEKIMEKYIHYPYGKDTILDFLLKDGSDGVSRGLICSQYANKVTKVMDTDCPSPAQMFRAIRKMEETK